MTTLQENYNSGLSARASSLFPFDDLDLLAIRLLPAEFARAIGVSKQTVSRWIKENKVTLGADGRLIPKVAMKQVLRNCDPGRSRARLVRQAYADMADLREKFDRVEELEKRLAEAERQIEYLEGFSDELDLASELAIDVLVDAADLIRATHGHDHLRTLFMELLDSALLLAGEERAAHKKFPGAEEDDADRLSAELSAELLAWEARAAHKKSLNMEKEELDSEDEGDDSES